MNDFYCYFLQSRASSTALSFLLKSVDDATGLHVSLFGTTRDYWATLMQCLLWLIDYSYVIRFLGGWSRFDDRFHCGEDPFSINLEANITKSSSQSPLGVSFMSMTSYLLSTVFRLLCRMSLKGLLTILCETYSSTLLLKHWPRGKGLMTQLFTKGVLFSGSAILLAVAVEPSLL